MADKIYYKKGPFLKAQLKFLVINQAEEIIINR